jgi:hypothetical protein
MRWRIVFFWRIMFWSRMMFFGTIMSFAWIMTFCNTNLSCQDSAEITAAITGTVCDKKKVSFRGDQAICTTSDVVKVLGMKEWPCTGNSKGGIVCNTLLFTESFITYSFGYCLKPYKGFGFDACRSKQVLEWSRVHVALKSVYAGETK